MAVAALGEPGLGPGCSADGGGLAGARFDAATQTWSTVFSGGALDDCNGFNQPF